MPHFLPIRAASGQVSMSCFRRVSLLVGLLLVALCAGPLRAAEMARRPAADFARLPFLEDPKLSPDGRKMLARISVDGVEKLAVVPLAGGERVVADIGAYDLISYRWVTDDWIAIAVGETGDIAGNEVYGTRLVRASADLSRREIVGKNEGGQYAHRVIWSATDGRPTVLQVRQSSIYFGDGFWPKVVEVDLATGRTRTVTVPVTGVTAWFADAAGSVRAGIGRSNGGRDLRLLFREGGSGPFRTIDTASVRTDERLLLPQLFGPDPEKLLAIQDDPDGFAALYEIDTANSGARRLIHGVPGYDIEGIVTDPTGARLLGVRLTDTAERVHWLDPEMAEIQKALDGSVKPGARVRIVSTSRDAVRMLVHVGSAAEPGRYYLFDRASGTMRHLAWVNDSIRGPLHPVSSFRCKARDGLEIEAVLTLPRQPRPGPLPAIVLPHGGPQDRDSERWDWLAQFLAERGYAVVQPNYRGSSGYGRAFIDKAEGQWGLAMQDDLLDAIRHLAAEGKIDPGRVCIAGASYGGYAAMRAAHRDAAHYRCAISYAGVSDLARMLRYDGRFLWGSANRDQWRRNAPDLAAVSPVNSAAEVGIPMLILHGAEDRRVPVTQSRILADRLKAAGKDVTYIEQKLGDHGLSREADRLEFLEAMETFLSRHNPA
jgi:dipeptidyl aminopeptidase/acylaminoacyl peptidase